jgi:hypothetical protein
MHRFAYVALASLALVVGASSRASACSAPPPPSVAKALASASAVFLARVVSVTHSPVSGDSSGRYVREVATFSVLETWKGSKRRGDTVILRTDLGPGPCGVSAVNDPVWLEQPGGTPVKLSGIWLIYAYGSEPYELQMSTRTAPLEVGGVSDLASLYQLAKPLRPVAEQQKHGT